MKTSRHWRPLVPLLVAGLLACGTGDQQSQMESSESEGAVQEEDTASSHAEGHAAAVDLDLEPRNQSGIAGRARVHQHGDSLHVSLSLTGLEPGSSYPVHVHSGTCETGGGVAVGLDPVASSDSSGTSSSTFPASAVSPDSSYFVQAHLSDGTPAACGNVPAGAFGNAGQM